MTLVYLVRHGVTEYNVHGQFQGSQDVPLDALGRRRAAGAVSEVAYVQKTRRNDTHQEI